MKHTIDHDPRNHFRTSDLPSEGFFAEIEAVFEKYGLSIGHQDGQGAFIIETLDQRNIEWLRGAVFEYDAAKQLKEAVRHLRREGRNGH